MVGELAGLMVGHWALIGTRLMHRWPAFDAYRRRVGQLERLPDLAGWRRKVSSGCVRRKAEFETAVRTHMRDLRATMASLSSNDDGMKM